MNSPRARKVGRLQRKVTPLMYKMERVFGLGLSNMVVESEEDFEGLIMWIQQKFVQYPGQNPPCLHCGSCFHLAWVEICCGNCEDKCWVNQRYFSLGRKCRNCASELDIIDIEEALLIETGETDYSRARELIENYEDLELRWLYYRLERIVRIAITDKRTKIFQSVCATQVPLHYALHVSSKNWDALCRRFSTQLNI